MLRDFRSCFFALIIIFLASCTGTKRLVYFNEDSRPDSNMSVQDIIPHSEATIQSDDILAINVASISFAPDDRPSQVFLDGGLSFNNSTSATGGGGSTSKNSYLVDIDGNIDYPRIGKMKMAGYTIREAKEQLALRLKDYLKQPVVEVRIVNYRITMLGEVASPGPILATNHKMTVIDAIAAAGGVPITGKIDNVLVIRDVNGKRESARIDLHSKNVFNSPYFYLRQNDIVYVEPSKIKKQEANTFLRTYFPIFTGVLSSAIAIFTLIQVSSRN